MALLDRIGFEALEAQGAALAARALSRLRAIPGLRVHGPLEPAGRVPVVTFTVDGVDVPCIVRAADAVGVAIRGGDLAALPLLRRFGVSAAARVSAYFYNTTDELDRLADVMSTMRRN
jgi:cysteine desulfurase/selenocysteine lyase